MLWHCPFFIGDMMGQYWRKCLAVALWFAWGACAHAQTSISTSGTLVIVPASGEVRQTNDEAHAIWMIEEQDKDKSVAASRANLKMKQGIDIIKQEDPAATLKTRGYYTIPVYQDEQAGQKSRPGQIVGWRVGQYLDVVTSNLNGLPRMPAAAQRILALNGLQFRLSESAAWKLEEKRIYSAFKILTDRIAAIAKAMGRNTAETVLESVVFVVLGAVVLLLVLFVFFCLF